MSSTVETLTRPDLLTTEEALEVVQSRPALARQYRLALEILQKGGRRSVTDHIGLGRIGCGVRDDAGRTYGDGAVDLLAGSLGYHRSTLRRAIDVVDTFTDEELREFETRLSAGGMPISPTHLRELVQLPTAGQRRKLTELFYTRDLSTRELHDRVVKLLGGKEGARPQPKNFLGGVRQLQGMSTKLRDRLAGDINTTVLARLRQLAEGKLRDAEPGDLSVVRGLHTQLEGLLADLVAVDDVLVEAEKALAGQFETTAAKGK